MEAGDRSAIPPSRAREAERVANCYVDLFELEARNIASDEGGYRLTDGRITMEILPWKISSFNSSGIEQPAMDHIGFHVPELEAFKAHVDKMARPRSALRPSRSPSIWKARRGFAVEEMPARPFSARGPRRHADRCRGGSLTALEQFGAHPRQVHPEAGAAHHGISRLLRHPHHVRA